MLIPGLSKSTCEFLRVVVHSQKFCRFPGRIFYCYLKIVVLGAHLSYAGSRGWSA